VEIILKRKKRKNTLINKGRTIRYQPLTKFIMKILKSIILSICLLFAFGIVSAEETSNGAQAVALDENVTAQDLGVQEPTVLPDSPFYFFKNLGREIQSALTFNPIRKAELREKFANEKLIELKKVSEKTRNPQAVEKATENYQKELARAKDAAEKIKDTTEQNPEVGTFLDKFIQQSTLHERILEKLETQVSTTTLAKIQEVRAQHLEKFGEVMNRLETNKEELQERLENNLEKVQGSEFKDFKNLEMLKALEGKVPEAAKKAIQQAQENALKRLKGDLESMSSENQTKFQDYIEQINGKKERQLEILDSLKTELQSNAPAIQKLLQTREKMIEQVKDEAETEACPQIAKPASTFCPNGRIIIKKDEKGCIAAFNCVIPAETNVTPGGTQACVALWDPVCGQDGKTYSNACFAKLAGTAIAHDDACKSLETGNSPQIREQIKSLVPKLTP